MARTSCCALVAIVSLLLSEAASTAQERIEERPAEKKLSPAELELRKSQEGAREALAVFGLGVMRHRGDRWLESVTLLEEAAGLDPDNPAAPRQLIRLYLSLAREEDALEACRKVLRLDPNDSETCHQYAKLLNSENRTAEAIAALTQGLAGGRDEDRSDLYYFMLTDLANLQEKAGDREQAAVSFRRLAAHLIEHRARLVGSDTLTIEKHREATARAYEKAGECHLQRKQLDKAVAAFEDARNYLAKQPHEESQRSAVRLNWNLAQVCLTREQWEAALSYLDDYLESRPVEAEPYEKKLWLLRKLGRGGEVLTSLRRYASRAPDALPLQLLYAGELAKSPRDQAAAADKYHDLSDRFGTPDVYRGMFRFYVAADKPGEIINLIDRVLNTVASKDEVPADVREGTRDRGRAILNVLRGDGEITKALLGAAKADLAAGKDRKPETWQLLGALASRIHQYEHAEGLFRKCLSLAQPEQELPAYAALLDVLWQQRKAEAVATLCKEGLEKLKKPDPVAPLIFRRSLALAYSESDKHDEALAEVDAVLKLAGEGEKLADRCRKARILAKAERWDAAVAECEELLKEAVAAADVKQVRYTLASIHTLKGDHEKSEAQLLKILADDPNDPGANNDLGYQWADRNHNLDQAHKMIEKAIEVDRLQRASDPDRDQENAAYLDSLGWVLFRKGQVKEACAWLEKAAAFYHGGTDPTVWDHLGDVYLKLGEKAKARESLQKAVKLYEHDKRGQKDGKLEEARKKLKMVGE